MKAYKVERPFDHGEVVDTDCRSYLAQIVDQPVVFHVSCGQIYCQIIGYGRQYKLEDMESEHPDLCAKVKQYFK